MGGRRKHYLLLLAVLVLLVTFVKVEGQITRSSCHQLARFQNSKSGFRLPSHVLDTVYVQKPTECVVNCLKHLSCKSINYKDTGTTDNICELNSESAQNVTLTSDGDFVYYGPATTELDCSFWGPGECLNGGECVQTCPDGLFTCQCLPGSTGATCNEITEFHNMEFPRGRIEDYISFQSNLTDTDTFTVLFWINTSTTTPVAVFSYGVTGSNQELLVVLDNDKLVLTVQTTSAYTFYIPPVNDGYWHHVGVVRQQTTYSIFLDGVLLNSVNNLGTSAALKGNGIFVLGQKMNNLGSNFDANLTLNGKLSQFSMWSSVLTNEVINRTSESCSVNPGDAVDSSNLKARLNGHVYTQRPSGCKSLRNDNDYDLVMSAGTTTIPTYAISPEQTTSDITAFTISLWVKFSSSSFFQRFVYYATADAVAMKFAINPFKRAFVYLGKAQKTEIPIFFNENPPFWHHLATSWSNSDGKWLIFLDGSMVAINREVAVGHIIPKGGKFVIGNVQTSLGSGMTALESFNGSLSRVNIWDFMLDGEAIWAMSKGPLLENGNLFAWFGIKQKSVGEVVFENTPTDLYNNRDETEYSLGFVTRSATNYSRITNPFPEDLTSLAVCFWANFKTLPGSVFAYSTVSYDSEFDIYMYSSDRIRLHIHSDTSGEFCPVNGVFGWNFYCVDWKSSDGKLTYYQNGYKLVAFAYGTGYVIQKGGYFVLGQEPDSYAGSFSSGQAMHGYISQLNMWTKISDNLIQGMASGLMNINGDLVQWRQFKDNIFGTLEISNIYETVLQEYPTQRKRDAYCDSVHPGYYARYVPYSGYAYQWRCVDPLVLERSGMIYDISSTTSGVDSGHVAQLKAIF